MTPQELKNSILQLAIQGRLVEQRPEEGTAEELYKRIQAEKQSLIKAGKLKKEKPLPPITDDEKPFEIPESWMWVRVANIITLNPKNEIPDDYDTAFIPMPCVADGYRNEHSYELKKWGSIKKGFTHFAEGDIGIAKITPCFQNRKSVIFKELPNRYGAGTTELSIVRTINNTLIREYLLWFFKTDYFISNGIKSFTGTAGQQRIHKDYLATCPIPLPPLAEQKRIVEKIEELLPLIDRYEKAWTRLEDFNKRFPDDMQKSILQMAIQGKLVEQRPEEGTAEDLYKQIQSEKQSLIKAGKIKKEKPLPPITDDEIPFEIPSSWKWVRIGNAFNLQAGKNITSSDIYPSISTDHQFLCYGGNGIRGYVHSYNRYGDYAIIGRQGALCGNINFASGQFYATEHAVVVERFANTDVKWCGLFLQALNLNQYATATAQPGLAVANINTVLIPLPPLAEQKRIVAKIEELLPLCERLK